MSDFNLQVLVPLLWTSVIARLLWHRRTVARQIGSDPVAIHVMGGRGAGGAMLDLALLVGASILTADIAANAMWPTAIGRWIGIEPLRDATTIRYVGLGVAVLGFTVAGRAIRHMGASWRVGIDHAHPGPMVSSGMYGRIRHPIYAAILLAVTGLAVAIGDVAAVGVAAGAWIGFPLQARREEAFLLRRYGEQYRNYCERTNRFWPRLH